MARGYSRSLGLVDDYDYVGAWLLGGVGLLALPFLVAASLNIFWVRILVLANIFAIFTLSWDILSGYTSYISFGHSFLIGVAGYTTAIITFHTGLPLSVSIVIAVLTAVVAGAVVFLPSLKLKGAYFTFVSLVLPIIGERIVIASSGVTGGERGLTPLPRLRGDLFPDYGILTDYYATMVPMLVIAYLLWRLTRSDFGTVLQMIEESEDLVKNAGINPTKFKFFVFTLSAFIAGIGGVLQVHHLGTVSISSVIFLPLSINIVIATIIGGRGSIIGAVGGAYIFIGFDAFLRQFHVETPYRLLMFYVVGMLFISLAPQGLFPKLWEVIVGGGADE